MGSMGDRYVHDVIVVGGGPSGVTTSLALKTAHTSADVLILEKATYPRDKYCAGAIGARGEKILASLDAMPDVPACPFDGMTFRGLYGSTSARLRSIGRVVRRVEFDAALAAIAKKRGVAIEEGTAVTDVCEEDDAVRVVAGNRSHWARVVVGADGVGSVVRRALKLSRGALRAQVLEVDTEALPDESDRKLIHFDASDRRLSGYYWDFPTTVDGKSLVCRGIYKLCIGDGRTNDLEPLFAERLAALGLDLSNYKNKRYAERGLEALERVGSGRLMLVGEAAGIDPTTGEGIAQAIEYGSIAGTFLGSELKRGNKLLGDAFDRDFRGTRLFRDLRIRERFAHAFYGDLRDTMDRFFVESDSAIHVGCQHFANEPYDLWHLLDAAVRLGAHALMAKLSG